MLGLMLRLFVAWSVPVEVRKEIQSVVRPLQAELPPCSWVRPQAYHITFAFVGDQPEAVVEKLSEAVGPAAASCAKFEAVLRGAGFFPSSRRPRVGWLGFEPQQPMVELGKAIGDAVRSAGLPVDDKPFRPHLTLVRTKDRWSCPQASKLLQSFESWKSQTMSVDHVSIYSSQLDPSGAVHTELGRFLLA